MAKTADVQGNLLTALKRAQTATPDGYVAACELALELGVTTNAIHQAKHRLANLGWEILTSARSSAGGLRYRLRGLPMAAPNPPGAAGQSSIPQFPRRRLADDVDKLYPLITEEEIDTLHQAGYHTLADLLPNALAILGPDA
jgi:hypothetical protein